MRLALFFLLIGLYLALRLALPLRLRWWWRLLAAAALLAAADFYVICYLLHPSGNIFCPDLPRWILVPGIWACMSLFFTFLLLVVLDVLRLPVTLAIRVCSKAACARWSTVNRRLNLVLLVAVCLLSAYGEYNALKAPEVQELTLHLPHYPKGAAPMKLALLCDIHADGLKRAPYIRDIVARTNALGAEAIVIAGDFTDGSVAEKGDDLRELNGLRAPLGVYGIMGNHDCYYGDAAWARFLQNRCGVRMLMNEHVSLGSVTLAGVDDLASHSAGPNIGKALDGVPEGACIVLLAHQPKYAPEAAAAPRPIDLQLSGHTHGGQIRWLAPLWAAFNKGYVSGLYRVRENPAMQLYVSRGTNLWSTTALRLGVPAEITLITLMGDPS